MPSGAALHILVTGLVQGVGYRFFIERNAEALGLCGWVRNLADGRVEAVFEGPKARIEEIVRCAEVGPPAARVEAIERRNLEPAGLRSFEVKRTALFPGSADGFER